MVRGREGGGRREWREGEGGKEMKDHARDDHGMEDDRGTREGGSGEGIGGK